MDATAVRGSLRGGGRLDGPIRLVLFKPVQLLLVLARLQTGGGDRTGNRLDPGEPLRVQACLSPGRGPRGETRLTLHAEGYIPRLDLVPCHLVRAAATEHSSGKTLGRESLGLTTWACRLPIPVAWMGEHLLLPAVASSPRVCPRFLPRSRGSIRGTSRQLGRLCQSPIKRPFSWIL